VSPAQANPIRPRYDYLQVAKLPKGPKPVTGGDGSTKQAYVAVGPAGVIGEGAHRKVDRGTWEVRRRGWDPTSGGNP